MNEKLGAPILCFGEVLLRLNTPSGARLMNSASLLLHVGGAEANVGAMLAQLGHKVGIVTVLPSSPLGDLCKAELQRAGVQCSKAIHAEGRLGLYFMESDARGGRILYDREHSAFAQHADEIDWPTVASAARLLHLSGINVALGSKPARSALEAVKAARAAGATISFDLNHRQSLWEGRNSEEFELVREIAGMADVLFASPPDLARLLGCSLPGNSPEERRHAAETAFERFERARIIASTLRWFEEDCHRLSARFDSRNDGFETEKASLGPIIDRIGSGDAFAGGVLDGLLGEIPEQDCAQRGLAAAVMKHGIASDRWIGSRGDLEIFDPFSAGDVRR